MDFKKDIDTICNLASLFGYILAIVTFIFAVYQEDINEAVKITIYSLVLLNAANYLGTIYIVRRYDNVRKDYNDLDKEKRNLGHENANLNQKISNLHEVIQNNKDVEYSMKSDISKIIHNFCHEYRKRIYQVQGGEDNLDKRKSSIEKFFFYLVENIKELFDILTKDKCSVCIKLIIPGSSDNDFLVRTYQRDSVSYRERSKIDASIPEYHHFENYAFKVIMDGKSPDVYFIQNDLANYKPYFNANENFEKYYNACMVVPIRIITKLLDDGRYKSVVLGFICVDNLKGGFDEEISLNLLASFSDLCFNLFNAYFEMQEETEANTLK